MYKNFTNRNAKILYISAKYYQIKFYTYIHIYIYVDIFIYTHMSNLDLENEDQRSNCQLLLDYRESK